MPVDLQTLYPRLIHLMLDTVFVVDSSDRIVFVSDACEALLGYRADELIGTLITGYLHPDDVPATRGSIERVMNGLPHVDFRNRYIRKDGAVVSILWAAFWSEEFDARIGVARNVTALAEAEQQLRFLAHHDPLTGLTNRALFTDRLQTALNAAQRNENTVALLFLDVNGFKAINDVHGHAVGDQVLCEIARRLQGCARKSDTVARMGGDEFTVLLTNVHCGEGIEAKVAQLISALAQPLGREFGDLQMPSCSIGVARFPEHGTDADALLSHADGEMYRVKRQRGR
ncbi:sensory box protein [Pseudomonas sp. StFLB209]|uniref:sensor domain-containing diguanylate cyclase n=1 Tax=Pseudomonas sp. StFLB209 TaxID=1028989 RepID=UPI0004F7BD7A|nr:sensor domain-containing diguanylate cyclase [Pseudomonas sp. StFLB209]BAP40928.1 sensory box protein [Pseudomonas sp. StFLB209]